MREDTQKFSSSFRRHVQKLYHGSFSLIRGLLLFGNTDLEEIQLWKNIFFILFYWGKLSYDLIISTTFTSCQSNFPIALASEGLPYSWLKTRTILISILSVLKINNCFKIFKIVWIQMLVTDTIKIAKRKHHKLTLKVKYKALKNLKRLDLKKMLQTNSVFLVVLLLFGRKTEKKYLKLFKIHPWNDKEWKLGHAKS